MKRSSLIPEQLSLSSRYFLKRSKIDISQKREIPARLQCTGPRGSLSGARSSDCGFLLRCDRFEDRHFTEREGFFRHEVRRSTRSGLVQERGSHRKVGGRKRVRPERLKSRRRSERTLTFSPVRSSLKRGAAISSYWGENPADAQGRLVGRGA